MNFHTIQTLPDNVMLTVYLRGVDAQEFCAGVNRTSSADLNHNTLRLVHPDDGGVVCLVPFEEIRFIAHPEAV